MIETTDIKDTFYSVEVGKPKTQIILCHSGRDIINYYNSLKFRMNGKYSKIPHFLITRQGKVIELIPPTHTSNFFGQSDVDDYGVFIVLENMGWLKKNSKDNRYTNWIGDTYRGEGLQKKWRDHFFWATYTEEQLNACAKVINKLKENMGLELDMVGHNVRVDGINKFKGLVSRSNYNNFWTDVSPAFNFEELKNRITNEK